MSATDTLKQAPATDPGLCGVCRQPQSWKWHPYSTPGDGVWITHCAPCRGTTRQLHYRWQDADEELAVCPDCGDAIPEYDCAFCSDEGDIVCLPCAREFHKKYSDPPRRATRSH